MLKLSYYFGSSYRRKLLDKLLEQHRGIYHGTVLDIGGRDRGRFKKPRDKVGKWIFADIEEDHKPDMVLDVANMSEINTGSIDVICAIELFEHVEKIEDGLKECHRILKNGGSMLISVPFLFPIHADPYDFQRWTEDKWKKELVKLGFKLKTFEVTGRFILVFLDMVKSFIKALPFGLRQLGYLVYPFLNMISKMDGLNWIKVHPRLGKYHGGYFIICEK